MRATAFRRISSLTGTECQPEAFSSPSIEGCGTTPTISGDHCVRCGGMDLSGTWRAAIADDDLRRDALGLDYDDSSWEELPVPGHWRSTAAFAETDGPLLY